MSAAPPPGEEAPYAFAAAPGGRCLAASLLRATTKPAMPAARVTRAPDSIDRREGARVSTRSLSGQRNAGPGEEPRRRRQPRDHEGGQNRSAQQGEGPPGKPVGA